MSAECGTSVVSDCRISSWPERAAQPHGELMADDSDGHLWVANLFRPSGRKTGFNSTPRTWRITCNCLLSTEYSVLSTRTGTASMHQIARTNVGPAHDFQAAIPTSETGRR